LKRSYSTNNIVGYLKEKNYSEMQNRKEELDLKQQQLKLDEEKFELEKKERLLKLENEKQEKQLMFELLKNMFR
jgi:hypothetical protein